MDLGETIREGFEDILYNFVYVIFYYIEAALCRVISWLESLFNVFAGIDEAKYNGKGAYLIEIFFGNRIFNAIYLGMAIIGITLAFIFTIISVVKKAGDLDDKVKMSYGQILRSLLRSIVIIVSMNLIVTLCVAFTNVLMESVTDAFRKAPSIADGPDQIQYTDEQFAAMSRIFNTIGNYSLNPSYKSRYNLNTCYNEIRTDLKYLGDTRVFNYDYPGTDSSGKTDYTWQYALERIARAADYNSEWPADKYNEKISGAILECMDLLKTDPSFHALEEYTRPEYEYTMQSGSLDEFVFLIGTMGMGVSDSSDTTAYNESPDIYDNVRAPYYRGEKSIYNLDQVNEDFDISVTKTNYLVAYFCAAVLLINLATILLNCMVRIFNLMFLYLIAPPVAATISLDDGGKFRQWTMAFIVQLFSVFATVISMRLFLIYVPIILNPTFEVSSSTIINMIGKMVMIWAGAKAVGKANGILTGILTDNAGMQSLMAGDMSKELRNSSIGRMASSAREWAEGKIKSGASKVAGTAIDVATLPVRPITGAASALGGKIASGWDSLKQGADSAGIKTVKGLGKLTVAGASLAGRGIKALWKKATGNGSSSSASKPGTKPSSSQRNTGTGKNSGRKNGNGNRPVPPKREGGANRKQNQGAAQNPQQQGGGMKPDRPIQDMEGPQINRNANGVKQDEPIADLKGPQINPNPGVPQNLPDAGGNRPVPPNRGGNRNRRGGENAENAGHAGQNIPEQRADVRAEQGGGINQNRPLVEPNAPIFDHNPPQVDPLPGNNAQPQNQRRNAGNEQPPQMGGGAGGVNAQNAENAGQNIPEQRAGVRAEQGGNRQPENRADGNQNNPQNPQQPLNRQQYEHLFGQDPNADDDHAQLPQMGGGVQAEQDGNAGVQPVPNQENPIEQPAQNAPDGNDVVHEQPANGDAPVNDANLAGIGNPRRRRTVPPANNRRRRPTNPAVQEMFRQLDEGQNPENPDDDPERPLPPQQRNQP